jgi:hypothetical protein
MSALHLRYQQVILNDPHLKNEDSFTNDGIIKEELFIKAPEKILWILKEPFGEKEKFFDYLGYINKFKFKNNDGKLYDTSSKLWHNITHVNYCIFKKEKWDNINNCWEDPEVFEALHHCALINLKKVKGNTSSNYEDISKFYELAKEIIKEQIQEINPSIIICGGTFKFIGKDLSGIRKIFEHNQDHWESHLWENRLVINAYHPSAYYESESYCDKITNAYLYYISHQNNLQ